nr:Rab family GTPase [Candidatus Sigynarchaeota archaeon]
YDITRGDTFENLKELLDDAKNFLHGGQSVKLVLVGNKVDLVAKREVSIEQGQTLAKELEAIRFFETSAKNGANVKEAFEALMLACMRTPGARSTSR